jgi:hypothetical protein
LQAPEEDVGEAEGVAARADGDHVGAGLHGFGLGRHRGEGVVRVLGEGRQVPADRVLGLERDVFDRGGAAADVGQLEERAEVAVDDLRVGLVRALTAVAGDFEGVAGGRDDPGGVGVAQRDPLVRRRRGGGLRPGELYGCQGGCGESCGRAEQGQTSAEPCHESSRDAKLASLRP